MDGIAELKVVTTAAASAGSDPCRGRRRSGSSVRDRGDVGDYAISLGGECQHLGIPVVGAEWPPLMKDDRLGQISVPILEKIRTPSRGH